MANEAHELRFAELSRFDQKVRRRGFKIVAGVDEAGRGPLAGPVVAAACILPARRCYVGIDDSKKLTSQQRSSFFNMLTTDPRVKYGIGIISAQDIDTLNIYHAGLQAMLKAVLALDQILKPDLLLVDGRAAIAHETTPSETVVGGDGKSLAIAAASILAKETRDRIMQEFHVKWPEYGFDRHKGYSTAYHLEMLQKLGPTPIHRRSFAPVRCLDLSHAADKL